MNNNPIYNLQNNLNDVCKSRAFYAGKIVYNCNHSIFRHDNFIGCFSADKIKKSVRKYFCFNITIYKNMAEELSCRKPFPKEYIQTSASGNPEDLYH